MRSQRIARHGDEGFFESAQGHQTKIMAVALEEFAVQGRFNGQTALHISSGLSCALDDGLSRLDELGRCGGADQLYRLTLIVDPQSDSRVQVCPRLAG
ncbi:MAG TPA: hypothetical protein DHV61_08325 [Glutamicibacter sp.]|nr:hypothetical protein [Glutamicibacter sp.]